MNNNPSEEEIINQAIKLHLQGKISEASKNYKYLIDQGLNDQRVFLNFGTILQSLGKLKEAELYTRKAIELKPDYAIAHSNLGGILSNLGNLKEAELYTRKAIELKPDYAIAHSNLGGILSNLGNLKEAELYTRKAIELKPDLAIARFNMEFILSDLGKLEELIIFSQSTLESKSISLGYKLHSSVRLAIANLLQKNFSEALLNLNKSKKLISHGAINIITNKKNRNHTSNFFNFINSLYPQLEKKNNHHELKKIPHIGESHCLSFAHQTLSMSSQLKEIQPVLITGAKAWHFASREHNKWKDSLTQQIKNHNYSDEIFISFGEIDCRKDEGILSYSIKTNKDISEICKKTIKGFLDHMEKALSPNHPKRYYFGIPAPIREKEFLDDLDIKRIEIIKIYNSLYKKEVLSRGSHFLDIYTLTSTNDGENNNLHMCDTFHLSPKCLSLLFENYLY